MVFNKEIETHIFKLLCKCLSQNGFKEKPHQLEGHLWCANSELNHGGGILADEMGLGKTMAMLALLKTNSKRRTLIVVPPSLLKQWKFVYKKFLNSIPCVFHGSSTKSVDALSILNPTVILTTYGMISTRKKEGYKSILWGVKWDRIIFDEAHNMREVKSKTFLGALKLQADIKWMITGTPIQNSPNDIMALSRLLGVKIKGDEHLKEFIKTRVLRRTKIGIGIDMPEVQNEIIEVPFASKEEEKLSYAIHSRCSFSNVTLKNVNRLIQSMEGINPLIMYIRARQMCILPDLIVDNLEKIKENDEMLEECEVEEILTHSKIDAVVSKMMSESKVEKKLVFCHYRKEIDYLKETLEKQGFKVGVLDGRTKKREFSSICASLEFDVLLAQIKSASEGLNLQQYSQVYFTSPHWNPAMEDQCIARCHRIGQQKQVKVFQFMMKWTDKSELTLDQYSKVIQTKKRIYMEMIEN